MQVGTGKTVLLTLGRLPKALELARCLSAAGCRVLIAEPFAWHLCRPSLSVDRCFTTPAPAVDQAAYLEALLQIIRQETVDLIIPVSEEALHVSLLADRLPPGTELLSQSHDRLMALHDKFTFCRQAERAGLPVPETHLATDTEAERLTARCDTVIKPRFGCSGTGMRFLQKGADLPANQKNPDTIVQRRISGREVSTLSFCRNGTVVGHIDYEGLVFAGSVATCFRCVDRLPEVGRWVTRFVRDSGYSGFIAFDFMVDDAGSLWPLECNPRLTSGIHFMDHTDLAAAILGDAPSGPIRTKPTERFQEGHTTLTMVYAGLFRPRVCWRRLKAMLSARDVLWSLRDPAPFWLMTPMSWQILRQVMFAGRSFGVAATRDIEWLPEDRAAQTVSDAAGPEHDQKQVVTAHEA